KQIFITSFTILASWFDHNRLRLRDFFSLDGPKQRPRHTRLRLTEAYQKPPSRQGVFCRNFVETAPCESDGISLSTQRGGAGRGVRRLLEPPFRGSSSHWPTIQSGFTFSVVNSRIRE